MIQRDTKREKLLLEDEILAKQAAHGSIESLGILFERYRKFVYSIAWKITLNEEDAMDVTQNVFEKIFQKIGTFKARGCFRSWIAAIAGNEANNLLRMKHHKMEVPTQTDILETFPEQKGASITDFLDHKQKIRIVENVMQRLSPQQRTVLTLRFKQDMSPMEISKYLGIPSNQVRSQICQALIRIRRMMPHFLIKGEE
jgi:RNA polymerase sigma factor (sigma-70 family)